MKQAFKQVRFQAGTLEMIERVNEIIAEYQQEQFDLTLRQLYYQLVSRDVIPNRVKEYKRLGSIVNDARLAGLIDWDAIVDRTRNLRSVAHWETPAEIVKSAAASYRIDKWVGQPNHVEVWVEKDALIGVVGRACEASDVPYFSCRGYVSQSEMYEAGRRLLRYMNMRQRVVILHMGDHDPSGIDMSRDIEERLLMFTGAAGVVIGEKPALRLMRIALTWEQIQQYAPPPNPAKETDSRFRDYQALHGDESWELDALNPTVLAALITEQIRRYRLQLAFKNREQEEQRGRRQLNQLARNWQQLVSNLEAEE